jgi:hypothetical protein
VLVHVFTSETVASLFYVNNINSILAVIINSILAVIYFFMYLNICLR